MTTTALSVRLHLQEYTALASNAAIHTKLSFTYCVFFLFIYF